MGDYICDNCGLDFDVDILNEDIRDFDIVYCPNCGTELFDEDYDD